MLPQELVDHIIDHLHQDIPTLGACTLVCRSWLDTTRLHKFATVTLDNRQAKHRSFATCPVAAPYVRTLRVTDTWSTALEHELSGCIGLQGLDLFNITIPTLSDSWPSFPLLKSLAVNLSEIDWTDLVHFLYRFPRLSSLSITNSAYTFEGPAIDVKTPPPPFDGDLMVGERIAFTEIGVDFLLHNLLSLPGGVRFRSISIYTMVLSIEKLNALLEMCGFHLKKLLLNQAYVSKGSHVLDLSHNPQLSHLVMSSKISPRLLDTLHTIRSNSIREIELRNTFNNTIGCIDELDILLSTHPLFENLWKLTMPQFKYCVLPRLRSQGVWEPADDGSLTWDRELDERSVLG